MGYYSYSTMGGFEVGRDTEKQPKDRTITEAVSYIYEDVKDIMSKGREEAKKNQGLMSKKTAPVVPDDDNEPSIISNVTSTARAFLGMLGKARPPSVNPLVGVATGITAGLIPDTGTTGAMQPTISEEIREFKRIDKPFDYSKVYKQYLAPTSENIVVPTPIGDLTRAALGGPIRRPASMANMATIFKKQEAERRSTLESERKNLIEELAMSESSNNYFAISKPKKGFDLHSGMGGKNTANQKIAIGRLQFIESRLKEYTKQTGKSTTGFLSNPTLQTEVEQWHIRDLEDFIKVNNLEKYYGQTMKGFVVDKDSIIAMAHLGGRTGTKNFLKSKGEGKTDKQDEYNTNLSDYGKKFSKYSFAPQTSPFPVKKPDSMEDLFKSPYPVKRPTNIVVSEDETNIDEMERINFEDIPIEQLLDPSTYLFGTNDREEKIKILREVYGIFIEVV